MKQEAVTQTMALAGLFQATELVRQAANHGTWSGYAATTCLQSLLALQSDSVEAVYGDCRRLRLGSETLLSVLQGENRHLDSLRYAVGLLQIERKFRRKSAMQRRIGVELEDLAHRFDALEEHERQDHLAEAIATLYRETVSSITPRIVVNGKPQYLQAGRTVNWIRTLLFSGLRSAVLWRQLGGGRWKLMFGRRQIIEDVRELLEG